MSDINTQNQVNLNLAFVQTTNFKESNNESKIYHGELDFQNEYANTGKALITPKNLPQNENQVAQILFQKWKIMNPSLIITVTGSAQNFRLSPKIREVFRRGIVKAAKATSAIHRG